MTMASVFPQSADISASIIQLLVAFQLSNNRNGHQGIWVDKLRGEKKSSAESECARAQQQQLDAVVTNKRFDERKDTTGSQVTRPWTTWGARDRTILSFLIFLPGNKNGRPTRRRRNHCRNEKLEKKEMNLCLFSSYFILLLLFF